MLRLQPLTFNNMTCQSWWCQDITGKALICFCLLVWQHVLLHVSLSIWLNDVKDKQFVNWWSLNIFKQPLPGSDSVGSEWRYWCWVNTIQWKLNVWQVRCFCFIYIEVELIVHSFSEDRREVEPAPLIICSILYWVRYIVAIFIIISSLSCYNFQCCLLSSPVCFILHRIYLLITG